MQTGLEILDYDTGKADVKDTDPSVDGSITESNIFKLKITIHIKSLWRPQYEFNLQALELDDMEVVKAHLCDANEEIKSLMAESRDSII